MNGSTEPTTHDLYIEHSEHVFSLLPSYGIPARDKNDVSQIVWMSVVQGCDSYDPVIHKSRRAWITGFVRRCAANYRRHARRHSRIVTLERIDDDERPDHGLDPEQQAIFGELTQLIPDDDEREALILHAQGLTYAEIAAVQEVKERTIEARLAMARSKLNGEKGKKRRSGAYLGYGSFEALAKALKPRPIPLEEKERQWQEILERIQREEAAPSNGDSSSPSSSFPPVSALPAVVAPPIGSALLTISKAKLTGLLVMVFLGGVLAGIVGMLASTSAAKEHDASATDANSATSMEPSVSASTAPITSTALSVSADAAPVESVAPSIRKVAPHTSASSTAPPIDLEAQRLITQMRHAMQNHQFALVLALADRHSRQFGKNAVREILRIEALRQMGRSGEAEQRAQAVVADHPEVRHRVERAAGHAVP